MSKRAAIFELEIEIDHFSFICTDSLDYILLLANDGNKFDYDTTRNLRLVSQLFYVRMVRLIQEHDGYRDSTNLVSWPFLKKICLINDNITSPIFDSLTCLTDLTIYNYDEDKVDKRRIRDNRSDIIAPFESLKRLTLSRTCGMKDEYFTRLTGLTHLSLYSFTDMCVTGLHLLSNLTSLELRNSSCLSGKQLESMTQLKSLYLSHNEHMVYEGWYPNDKKYFLYDSISLLTNLNSLSFVYDHTPGKSLKYLTNLTHLDLSHCTGVESKSICLLTNLKSLNLTDTKNIYSDDLCSLTSLTKLNLAENHLIKDTTLLQLTNLTELDLCSNYTINAETVLSLPLLKELSVNWIGHPLLELRNNPKRRFEIAELDT